jgi:hypothetical protein
MHSTPDLERHAEIVEQSRLKPLAARLSRYPRETILMWCIGTASGAAMLTLLAAMCLAEISIHRTASNATAEPANSAPVTLAASR